MPQTLYEIVDDFEGLMGLLDEITDPNPHCQLCNPDGDYTNLRLRQSAAGDEWISCPSCDDTGKGVEWNDETAAAAIAEQLEQVELDLSDKSENIVRLIASWDAESDMLKAEEGRLRARRQVRENKVKRLRSYLTKHMERAGIKKIETDFRNIGFRQGLEVVIIDDEDALPDELVDTQVVMTPKKKEIKPLAKAYQEAMAVAEKLQDEEADNETVAAAFDAALVLKVPGAHIERNPAFVVIK
jgi:uncharacterized Zn finger protein (UPF0148 family)